MIQIIFEFDTQYGVYRDALWLPEDHTYTQDEIDTMELERVTNWINMIENPPVDEENQTVDKSAE
jgi:hypothetical protein